jgi:hypothetical protein
MPNRRTISMPLALVIILIEFQRCEKYTASSGF